MFKQKFNKNLSQKFHTFGKSFGEALLRIRINLWFMANKNYGFSQQCILYDVLIKEFSYIWINSGEGVVQKVNISVAVHWKQILLKWDFVKTILLFVSVIMPLSIVSILICQQFLRKEKRANLYSALARLILCFWPPLSVTPLSPTFVLSPCVRILRSGCKQQHSITVLYLEKDKYTLSIMYSVYRTNRFLVSWWAMRVPCTAIDKQSNYYQMSFSRCVFLSDYLTDLKLHNTNFIKKLPLVGCELTTSRSSVWCSDNWASQESVGDFWSELSFVSCTTSHVGLCLFLEPIEHDFIKALMIHTHNQIVTLLIWQSNRLMIQRFVSSNLTGDHFWWNLFCAV